ncbi:SGNH/GDSL hydrolase family protein [Ktedonospora formicarum]|uniref:SGNH/GDSL hydrolase family protein n=1 Tax=Ktedonospora formicarum TaxID=2778364 RepID=UPI003B75C378
MPLIEEGATVLFQGDSITDAGRWRSDEGNMGQGYAMIASALFGALYPERRVRFLNRGISGDRVKDLRARWELDCLELRPNWVSILIGVNDTWRRFDQNEETRLEVFTQVYRTLLEDIKGRLDAKVILCEPFVLPSQPQYVQWREDLDPKIQAVRELAREFDALLVPFDGLFAQACERREAGYWGADGVHPSSEGHALMARSWLRVVKAL